MISVLVFLGVVIASIAWMWFLRDGVPALPPPQEWHAELKLMSDGNVDVRVMNGSTGATLAVVDLTDIDKLTAFRVKADDLAATLNATEVVA